MAELLDAIPVPVWIAAVVLILVAGIVYSRWTTNRQSADGQPQPSADARRPRFADGPEAVRADPDGWQLVATARYALNGGQSLDVFGYDDRERSVEILRDGWEITDQDSLLTTLMGLITAGHRAPFDQQRSEWIALDDRQARGIARDLAAEAAATDDATVRFRRFQRIRHNSRDIRSVDFAAWDLARALMLLRAGIGAGYLEEPTARDLGRVVATGLQARFQSWPELDDHFVRGRWYWLAQGGRDEAASDAHDKGVSETLAGTGLWQTIPWQDPLPQSSYRFVSELPAELRHTTRLKLQRSDQEPWLTDLLAALSG